MLARRANLVSAEEYLRGELVSDVKHEYIAGAVYAMAGATNQHNQVAGNLFAALHARLRGKPCRAYNSDTKIRVRLPDGVRFYYPDVQVTCKPNPPEDTFQDQPIVIAEVLSESTRRMDEGEKREAYLSLPSLETYLLVESDAATIVAFRRTSGGFVSEVYAGHAAVIPLRPLALDLPLVEVYDDVTLSRSTDGLEEDR